MFVGGKATKRSKLSPNVSELARKTIEATKLVLQARLKIHVIDAEWRMYDVPPGELEELLGLFPNIKTYITLAARRRDVDQLLNLYVPVIEEFENAGLCVVAGNKAYLDEDEASRSAYKSIKRVLHQLSGRVSSILLGVEGIESKLNYVVKAYSGITPFFLYDEEKLGLIEKCYERGLECAVYVPYAIDRPPADVVVALADYALRRKWLRDRLIEMGYDVPSTLNFMSVPPRLIEVLQEAVSRLSIYGTKNEVVGKIRELRSYGVSMFVGLPIFDTPDQVLALGECIRNA
ncbi:MAG: hypothetical protein QE164_05535 [Candidatus Nezhaarchaeota archaeon]|nr:hypothetical protein [Candidatus Nezhaarchaeota archaeon]